MSHPTNVRGPVRAWWHRRNLRTSSQKRIPVKPLVEVLEDRFVPTTFVQTGGVLTQSAELLHRYDFDDGLNDVLGGPALVDNDVTSLSDGTVAGGRYTFAAGEGLSLSGGLSSTPTTSYSIEIVMEFDSLFGEPGFEQWKKIIDFTDQGNDNGLYLQDDKLTVYPGNQASGAVSAPNTDFHVVITRDGATGETKTYLNGALQFIYTGIPSDGVVSATNHVVFFEDDGATVFTEAQGGSADYIAIYGGPLDQADVTALYNAHDDPLPTSVSVLEGQTATMSGTFYNSLSGDVTVTATIGNVVETPLIGPDGTWSWSFLADDGPAQSQTVTITANDGNGNVSTTTFVLTVGNVAPTATLTNNGPVSEGATAVVSFTSFDPSTADFATLHYAFDFDNDGTFEVGDGTYDGSPDVSSAVVPGSFLFNGPGALTVAARVIDKDDASNDYTTEITINSAAPSIAPDQATVTVDEGQTATNTGTFSDPGGDSVTLSASVGDIVDNGDGTWSWSLPTVDGPEDGLTVTVTATDIDDNLSTSTTFTVVVDNVAPTIGTLTSSATVGDPANPGELVTVQGSFSDPGAVDVHHAVIAWGDGAETILAETDIDQLANTFSATHAYGSGATFTVTVTLFDDDGDDTTATTTAVVVAPQTPGSVTVEDGALIIIGTDGSDDVFVAKVSQDQLKVHASFLPKPVLFNLADIDRIIVDLGAGDDCFDMAGSVRLPVVVHGGAGNDFLQNGGGPGVLLGEAGNDKVKGGKGRDILMGGVGRDHLHGGEDDDILIGGTSSLDLDDDALFAALAVWTSHRSFAGRAAGFNAAVFDDFESDFLKGGARRDLVFRGKGDVYIGRDKGHGDERRHHKR